MNLTNTVAWLKAAWARLVTKEKALFKSSTVYLSAMLASAPTTLPYIQSNWPQLAPYLPHVLQDKGLAWVGLAVFVCRMRSMVAGMQVTQ